MSDFVYQDDEQDNRGWRSDPFAGQRIDVPLGDVTDAPRVCVEMSLDWAPIIIGALERLKFGDMWNGDASDIARAADNIDTLQAMLGAGECEGGNMDYTCYELPLHSPIVDWLPADPFDNNPSIPPGYNFPPWQIITVPQPLEGYQVGDVVVNLFSLLTGFPPIIPASGVPRMQLTVQGPAEVDIEFARVFQGGIALVLVDGVPRNWVDLQLYNVGDLLNVNSWLEVFGFAVDSFTRGPLELPVECPNAQEYVIEVQMFPRPALDFTLGYGGGVRGISICSEQEQIDLSPFVTDVRLNGGVLEKEIDDTWVPAEAVTDHVDASVLVRGNGCQIEGLRAWDVVWSAIESGLYLDIAASCTLTSRLNILQSTAIGMSMNDGTRQGNQGPRSGYHNIYGTEGLSLYDPANQKGFYLGWGGSMSFRDQFLHRQTASRAMVDVVATDSAKPALHVEHTDSGQNTIAVYRRYDGIDVVEVSKEGWFSAMQQLIVNDLSSTGAKRGQGRLLGQWADDTDATRKGRTIIQADDHAGVREGLRVEADGAAARLGFYGAAAVAKATVTGATALAALNSLLAAAENLGLITDSTAITAGGEGLTELPYYEAMFDMSLDRPTGRPIQFATQSQWGDFVNQQGFVSELDAGPGTTMQLRVEMNWKYEVTIRKMRLTFICATGADGDFAFEMHNNPGGLIIDVPMDPVSANGPETLVVEVEPIEYRSDPARFLRFQYVAFNAISTEIVTLQKIEVLGDGHPEFDFFGDMTAGDIYNHDMPDWST